MCIRDRAKPISGAVLPVLLAALLVIGVATGAYAVSAEGPGSKHAPIILSLVVALIIGALAQKSRMCFAGSIRDIILMKNFDLISICLLYTSSYDLSRNYTVCAGIGSIQYYLIENAPQFCGAFFCRHRKNTGFRVLSTV